MKLPLALLLLSSLVFGPVRAAPLPTDAVERQRIAAERAEVEKAFAAREVECRERFVVMSCLDAARRDRRDAMERLHQQQVVLDEAQRKQRAAERIEDIRNKVSADDAKRREAQARVRAREARLQEQAETAGASASAAAGAESVTSAAPQPVRAAKRVPHSAKPPAQRASDYEKRQADAKAHREAVERRNAERAAKSKPSKPLPLPMAPSASQ